MKNGQMKVINTLRFKYCINQSIYIFNEYEKEAPPGCRHVVHSGCYATDTLAAIYFIASPASIVSVCYSFMFFNEYKKAGPADTLCMAVAMQPTHELPYIFISISDQHNICFYYAFAVCLWCKTVQQTCTKHAFFCCDKDVLPLSPVPKFRVPITLERGFTLAATHGYRLSCLKSCIQ